MKIDYSKRFNKQYGRLRAAEQLRFKTRLRLWEEEPTNPILRVHALEGVYLGFYSFNVGGDLRALYKFVGDEVILFDFIGTHSQLYG